MPRGKKIVDDVELEAVEGESAEKTAFRKMIANYKEQNPEKYATKEDSFIKRLDAMK